MIAITRYRDDFFRRSASRHPRLEVIGLDFASEKAVERAVSKIHRQYGRIDVLINNAGSGNIGAVEEASQEDISRVFEGNVFTALRMIRQVLPYMRAARSGHIINISSIGGITAAPGFGIYNAARSAVEGFSEAMHTELKELGIKVTVVEPGNFRTNFLGNSLAVAKKHIEDYRNTAGRAKKNSQERNGQQQGDPDRAAKAIYRLSEEQEPPFRLLLGEDAWEQAPGQLISTAEEIGHMRPLEISTAFNPN